MPFDSCWDARRRGGEGVNARSSLPAGRAGWRLLPKGVFLKNQAKHSKGLRGCDRFPASYPAEQWFSRARSTEPFKPLASQLATGNWKRTSVASQLARFRLCNDKKGICVLNVEKGRDIGKRRIVRTLSSERERQSEKANFKFSCTCVSSMFHLF